MKGAASDQATTRQPGLDGLRALAVIAVIAFHERLSAFSGGFLGVDVFFVLSGYLITDLLVARWDRHGRLDLGDFWARRARRLLPALAVLLVAVTAATAVVEPAQLAALRSALLAAVTYSSNWWQALAHHSYFAQFGPPPPLQHLWSLAIEEQFYLVWPLLLIVILKTCQSGRLRAGLAWLGAALSAVLHPGLRAPGAGGFTGGPGVSPGAQGAGGTVFVAEILKRCVRIGGLRCARRHRGGEAGARALQPLLADGRQPLTAFPQVQ